MKFAGRNLRLLIIRAAVLLLPLFFIAPGVFAQNYISLVESVPEETFYEQSGLKRTENVWMELINSAKSSIHIETFYFADSPGSSLNKIIDGLKKSAAKGVSVKIIIDSSFYAANEKGTDQLEGVENIEIRKIPMRNIAGGVMHAKYLVVDGEAVFLGSQNMDWRALTHIHEMGIVVSDKRLAETFEAIFRADWELCEGNASTLQNFEAKTIVSSKSPVIIADDYLGRVELFPVISPFGFSLQGSDYELDELLRIINNAREKLNIQIYSYSLSDRQGNKFTIIDSALRSAAGRGIKIRMLLPDWAMKPAGADAVKNLSIVPNISVKIISIPLHSSGFIPFARVDHCKYFTCDNDLSWVGTTNWERGYFFNSRNISLVMRNSAINSQLNSVFESVWESAYAEFVDVNKKYEEVKRQ